MQSICFQPLLDTGADVTIVSTCMWPKSWPTQIPDTRVLGVGGTKAPTISSRLVTFVFPKGQQVALRPYVMSVPGDLVGLIGRDILAQIGATITTTKQGF